jgi:hypothetical protein
LIFVHPTPSPDGGQSDKEKSSTLLRAEVAPQRRQRLFLSGVAVGSRQRGTVWFAFDPLDEPADVRVSSQSFERIVLSLEFLVVEDDVHVPVAGGAQTYRMVDLPPVERLLVSLVLVARPGDEVVPGQLSHRALTQFARAAVSVAHLPMLASAEATPK